MKKICKYLAKVFSVFFCSHEIFWSVVLGFALYFSMMTFEGSDASFAYRFNIVAVILMIFIILLVISGALSVVTSFRNQSGRVINTVLLILLCFNIAVIYLLPQDIYAVPLYFILRDFFSDELISSLSFIFGKRFLLTTSSVEIVTVSLRLLNSKENTTKSEDAIWNT